MTNRRLKTLSCAIAVATLGTALPAAAADAENGQRLATRWCAACHVVTADQRQASADAPPFTTVAQMPGFNAERLAFFLLQPHPKMPDMGLSRRDAEDIAAFIAGQRR
jgi:mono/diheme cytochrome c family protein